MSQQKQVPIQALQEKYGRRVSDLVHEIVGLELTVEELQRELEEARAQLQEQGADPVPPPLPIGPDERSTGP